MDDKRKGVSWFSCIYQKFEAVCLEVEDLLSEEKISYVNNQLQAMGSNVSKFCSEFAQEMCLSSSANVVEDAILSPGENSGVESCDVSDIVEEVHSTKEHCDTTNFPHLPSEVSSCLSLNQNAGLYKKPEMVHRGADKDLTIPKFHCFSDRRSNLVETYADNSKAVPHAGNIKLTQNCGDKNLEEAYISTDGIKVGLQRKDHFTAEEAGINVKVAEPCEESVQPTEKKLDECCVMIDMRELSDGPHDAKKSMAYKRGIRKISSSRKRLAESNTCEQHAWSYNLIETDDAISSVGSKKSDSQDHEFCESEWEII